MTKKLILLNFISEQIFKFIALLGALSTVACLFLLLDGYLKCEGAKANPEEALENYIVN